MVFEQVGGRRAPPRIHHQHFADKRLALRREVLGEVKLSEGDLPVEVFVVLAAERKLPTQHGEEEDSRGPDISRRAIVLLLADNLGAHVAGRSAENLQLDVLRRAAAEAKVY